MKYKLFPWLIGFLLLVVIIFASFPAPAITQTDPSVKQNKVTFNAPFTLHFSDIMNRRSVEDSFMVLPKIEGKFRWGDLRTLEFIPDEPLTIDDEYRIVIKGKAKSIWMRKIGYDTMIDYLVTGPPYVLFVNPPDGSVLTKDGAITVMFDRPMGLSGKNEKDLIKIDPQLSGEVEFFGMSAFQFIAKTINAGQTYKINIPAGLKALDGGVTAEDFSWTITTPGLKIEKSEPENGTTQAAVDNSIRIYFNAEVPLDDIKPGINAMLYPSNDLDADKVKKTDGFFNTEVTYAVNEEGDARKNILVFAPTFDYQPGEQYRFVLKGDKDLHLAEDFELKFSTIGAPEETEGAADNEAAAVGSGEAAAGPLSDAKNIEYFVRGENPRLTLDKPLSEPAVVSVCQVSSNEFIRVSAKNGWSNFKCGTGPVTIKPAQEKTEDAEPIINLNDYFNIDWVTGVYFVSITQGEQKTVRYFLIEDSVLLMKHSDSDLFVWALDLKSGKPITDMELEILSYDGSEIARAKTDKMGFFSIDRTFDEGIYVRGKKEEDGISRWGLVSDRWTLHDSGNQSGSEDFGLRLFLDQNVFLSGEDIKFKGIWRLSEDHQLSLPVSAYVTVSLEDPQHNYVVSKRIPLRRNGSFDGTLSLPEDLSSGLYMVSVTDVNQQSLTSPVPVQVKNGASDLSLEWITGVDDHISETTPVYIVKARYKNGIPAAGVNGHFELFRTPVTLSHQEGAVSYTFESLDDICAEDCRKKTLANRGDFEFDLNGETKLLLTDGNGGFLPAGNNYDLLVTAVLSGEAPTGIYRSFKVHQGGFDLGLGVKHALIQANETIEASIISLNHAGQAESGNKVRLSLVSLDQNKKTVYEDNLETGAAPLTVSIPVTPTMIDGVYLLRARSQDEKHNEVLAELPVYVSTNPLQPISDDLLLAADQTKYFVGGRAHLMINEPSALEDNPVTVIVTYERDGLLDYETLELTSPVTRIAVPIKESMMPYFEATVTRFNRGVRPSFSTASQNIQVGNDASQIFIDLSYSPPQPGPGEEVTLKFRTYDFQDRPLSSVISLNILNQEFSLPVLLYDSFFPGEVSTSGSASNISPRSGSSSAPEHSTDYAPAFFSPAQSVYFDPLITTSAGGESEIKLTLPAKREDLIIQAIATKDTGQFGSLSSVLHINQQLRIQPILPGFAVPGDQTVFAASVKNISDKPVQSRLEFLSSDVSVKGDSSHNFSLQPGQQTEIAFAVLVDNTLDKDKISVRFRSGDDVAEGVIFLRHLKSRLKIPDSGLLGDVWTGRIQFPNDAYPAPGSLQLTFSGSPLAFGKIKAEALEEYTFSSTYLLAARLLTKLSLPPDETDETPETDSAAVQNMVSELLKSADINNGAYRFWNEPQASPTLSALVLFAFSEASSKGLHADSLLLNRTITFLLKALDEDLSLSPDDKAFILWVLSKNGQYDTKRALDYFQNRENAGVGGKAFLLMNLNQLVQAGQGSMASPLNTLKAELIDEAIVEESFVYFDAPPKVNAIALYALSELDSANPLLTEIANYLTFQDGDLLLELDPEEALWTVLALKNYVGRTDYSAVNFITQIKVNGNTIVDQSVTGQNADKIFQKKIGAETFDIDGINDIFVKKDGTDPFYLDANLTCHLDPAKAVRVEDGLIIVRKFFEITDEGKKIPAVTFRKGKNYLSELSVAVPKDYRFVALSDTIPAGMKIHLGSLMPGEPFSQVQSGVGNITYFAPVLPAGVYKIDTELQAVLSGTYLHLPASVQAIFEPSVVSRTEGNTVQIID
ncbi:MAG: Ig-like domain-containing protein [Patescibacteria group bacterium]